MRGSSAQAYTPPPLRGERFAAADHGGRGRRFSYTKCPLENLFRRRASFADCRRIPIERPSPLAYTHYNAGRKPRGP